MSPEREQDYADLLAYIGFFATNVMQVDSSSPVHPANAAGEVVTKFGRSKALVGLRHAANDTVEQMSGWNAEAIAILDRALLAANVVTASEIRRRFASSFKRVVRRGSIKTETEYYLVKGICVDLGNRASNEERLSLERLLTAYEEGV